MSLFFLWFTGGGISSGKQEIAPSDFLEKPESDECPTLRRFPDLMSRGWLI
jgi:hypothetical protein